MKTLTEYYYDIKFEIVGRKLKRQNKARQNTSVLYMNRRNFYLGANSKDYLKEK